MEPKIDKKVNKIRPIYAILKYFILPLSIPLIAGYILLCASPNIAVSIPKEGIEVKKGKPQRWTFTKKDLKDKKILIKEEIEKESFLFYNKSLIPGFIDKVEITPEEINKPLIKIEILEIDRRKLNFFWSFFYPEERTVKLKYTYTYSSASEKGAVNEETIITHMKVCFYDNKGQFINYFDKFIVSSFNKSN